MKNEPLIVGLGASAGGVEALKSFFKTLPESTGISFVVVIHLSPDHESHMAELLQMQTSLKVTQIKGKTEIEQDQVYVVPPGKMLKVTDNHLEITDPRANEYNHVSIDLFFRSLAEIKGKNSACVVLSGTGSDGAIAMKTVKENGGISIAQDPDEAEHNSMPRAAIETGCVDLVLPVKEIGQKLIDYRESLSRIRVSDEEEKLPETESQVLNGIFDLIRSRTSRDFSQYKRSSVLRRIERRLHIHRIDSLSDYHSFLKDNPKEIDELFKDLLISVTNFFRDPEAFEVLEKEVIPQLFENVDEDDTLRVWVPGCATGEEAYSVAILLKEHADTLENPPELKVFATDIDEEALVKARKGRYPQTIFADLSKRRLNRFFYKDESHYTVREEIRELVLFAVHDLLRDPPFSKIDLITCRNLLIYLNRELQADVFNIFHYCLRDDGWLFLGQSDSNLTATELFSVSDKDHRIYRRTAVSKNHPRLPQISHNYRENRFSHDNSWMKKTEKKQDFGKLHHKLLMHRFTPPSAIVNENYEVLHSSPGIEKYLKYTGGEPSRNILEMVLPDYHHTLRGLLFQVGKKEKKVPVRKQVQSEENGDIRFTEIIVQPVHERGYPKGILQVVFMDSQEKKKFSGIQAIDLADTDKESEVVDALESELEYTKEQLQITVEEYETSNEDLRASNEELQSMNEELQSTTEELETSKEELQSVNEELKTVNRELEEKIKKLHRVNSDLKNLMEATEVGTIFVNRDGCVKRFTSSVTEIFNLIASDEGRPVEHVTHNLKYDSLLEDINHVLDNLVRVKKVVSTDDGNWYIMRVRPYQNIQNEIEGVVITFVEITDLKNANRELEQRTSQQQALAELGLLSLDERDEQVILDKAAGLITEHMQVAYSVLFELEDKTVLVLKAGEGWAEIKKDELRIEVENDTQIGHALASGEPVVVTDYKNESRFEPGFPVSEYDVVSGITVVLKGKDEQPFGVIGAFSNSERVFSDYELDFLQITANILGEFFSRRRAEDELLETNKKLERINTELRDKIEEANRLQQEIIGISERERWETGQYLHDELGQMMVAAQMQISTVISEYKKNENFKLDELKDIKNLIDEAGKNIRELSHDVTPVNIEHGGVEHAFNELARNTSELYDCKCFLNWEVPEELLQNEYSATHIHRIAKEAVTNAVHHGKADEITISLSTNEQRLLLTVEDNGIGYSEDETEGGVGIQLMRYRSSLMNGSFNIKQEGEGTIVSCSIPLEFIKSERTFRDH